MNLIKLEEDYPPKKKRGKIYHHRKKSAIESIEYFEKQKKMVGTGEITRVRVMAVSQIRAGNITIRKPVAVEVYYVNIEEEEILECLKRDGITEIKDYFIEKLPTARIIPQSR